MCNMHLSNVMSDYVHITVKQLSPSSLLIEHVNNGQ